MSTEPKTPSLDEIKAQVAKMAESIEASRKDNPAAKPEDALGFKDILPAWAELDGASREQVRVLFK